MFTAADGMIYRNKLNGITAKVLIIGSNDSIDNYELIPEPAEEEPDNSIDL
ncbi:MAG: hypothetical protein IJU45_09755 [Clostridia bacterium]|nr:hypothetical protein [Clostridia bacterium]